MEAIEKFIKSKELGYSTKEADDQLIFCYQKLNQYDKVIEIAQYYIDQGMDEYGFYSTNIAEAYSGKGNKDMEFAYYDYAVQNGISKEISLFERAGAYQKYGELDKAMDDLNEICTMSENFSIAFGKRGDILFQQENYEAALKDYSHALEQRESGYTYCKRGKTYLKLRHYPEALLDFNRAEHLDGGSEDLYNARGVVYAQMKNYECALADYFNALAYKPDDAIYLYNIGWVYSKKEEYNNAIDYFTQSINSDNKDYKGYSERAVAYKAMGEKAKAEADFEKAKELRGEN